MSKYVKSCTLKLDENNSFNELVCDYPKYVDIIQDSESSVSVKLMDEAGRKHHLTLTAHTEKLQQDGLTSEVFLLDVPFAKVFHEIAPEEEKVSVTLNMRLKGIWCCLWFGTMPWRLYEKKKHYRRGYWKHLKLNWATVWMWLVKRNVGKNFVEFENQINPSWKHVFKNMFGGLR
jgi:hypothetical protein